MSPGIHLHEDYIHVIVVLAPALNRGSDETPAVLDSYVGRNWVVTRHDGDSALVDEFRELATGAGQLGRA